MGGQSPILLHRRKRLSRVCLLGNRGSPWGRLTFQIFRIGKFYSYFIAALIAKEDPSIKIKIDEETGESLMSGMGELHLEIIENRIKTEKGLDVKTSPPIIVYRETVSKESSAVEGISPNKHNSFIIKVEPLEDDVFEAIKSGELSEKRIKKKDQEIANKFMELG